MEYVFQLQEFFNRFSFLFWYYGPTTNPIGTTDAEDAAFLTGADLANTPINYTKSNFVPDHLDPDLDVDAQHLYVDEGWNPQQSICDCFLDSDLRLRIKLGPIFLGNFYIECQDHFATRMGFPPTLYHIIIDAQEEHMPPELFGDLDAFTIEAREELTDPLTWTSTFSA